MSSRRDQTRRAFSWFPLFKDRLRRVALMLQRTGRNPNGAMEVLRKNAARADRARWKRWYQANKKYQRQRRALRQAGLNVRHWPSSLLLLMVP